MERLRQKWQIKLIVSLNAVVKSSVARTSPRKQFLCLNTATALHSPMKRKRFGAIVTKEVFYKLQTAFFC